MAVVHLTELPRAAPLAGLDLGEKTIGVAVSDATQSIAGNGGVVNRPLVVTEKF